MIAGAGAGDIEQMPLRVVDLLKVGVLADRLDPLLQGDDLVVAGHHDHRPELQSLGKVHGPYRDMPAPRFDLLDKHGRSQAGSRHGAVGARQLRRGADEDAELIGERRP